MAFNGSRRKFLTRFIKPVTETVTQARDDKAIDDKAIDDQSSALPDGVNILLKKDLCIAWGRGLCDRCNRVCPENALFFVGLMNPRIIDSRCTWCSLCVPVCPVDAIVVRPEAIPELETEES